MPKRKHAIHAEQVRVVRRTRIERMGRAAGLFALLAIGPLATYAGASWWHGWHAQHERHARQTEQTRPSAPTAQQEAIAQLQQERTNAVLAAEVDRRSVEQLRQEVLRSRQQLETMEEQIRFYQSLMDPDPQQGGIYVESVQVTPISTTDPPAPYRLQIIVAQRSSDHRKVAGQLHVRLSGQVGDTERTLGLPDLTAGDAKSLPLDFKFFQQLEAVLRLPADFRPLSLGVQVRLAGDSAPRIDETHLWDDLQNGSRPPKT
ncbi:MAG: hypothetical protein GDA55_01615 [Cellvibrionales bacterium]|nr:hypothetical protein [Cellvibrionales bacterium]